MQKMTLALIYGGVSSEREVSLNSGQQVYEALDKAKYEIIHYDPKTDLPRLVADAANIDAALIILHGPYGEDGTVQGLLELLNIPYQGAGVLGSALAMNKLASKRMYQQTGIPIPPYQTIRCRETPDADHCIRKLGLPLVVKPVEGGSSVGMSIVRSETELEDAVSKAFEYDDVVLIETYIDGVEITCGVIGNDDPEALPLIEIIPNEKYEFFDYEAKYTAGATQEICPARIDTDLTAMAKAYGIKAHQALFCQGYSRTDMIIKDRNIYVIETNTIPGMTATSLYPQSAAEAGIPFGELMDKLIQLGIEAKAKQ